MIGSTPFSGFSNPRPVGKPAKPAGLLAPGLLDADPDTGALVPPVNMPDGMKPLPPIDGPTIPTVTGKLLEPHMEPAATPSLVTDPMTDKSPRTLLQQTQEYQQLEAQRKAQGAKGQQDGAPAQPQAGSNYQIQSDPIEILDLGLRYQPSQYRR
jgi:hypothetical protein